MSFLQRYYKQITLCFIAVLYLVTLRGIAGNYHPNGVGDEAILSHYPPFETSLERGRYGQIISLVEQGTFNADAFPEFMKPDLAWYSGHYYSAFPPGVAIMTIPFYLIGKMLYVSQVMTFFMTTVMSLACCYLMILIAQRWRISPIGVALGVVIFALATPTWSYSVTFSAHLYSAFFITLSYYMALIMPKEHTKKKFWLMLGLWVIYGINFFIDYPNLVILAPIIAYASLRHLTVSTTKEKIYVRGWGAMLLPFVGILPFLALFVWYNLVHFQKPIAFTNTFNLLRLSIQGVEFTEATLSNDLFKQKPYSERFQVTRLFAGLYTLLFSTDRGIFHFSPISILSVIGGIWAVWRRQSGVLLLLAVVCADLLLYGSFDDPYGGWSFGPRYLIPVLPLTGILAGYAYDAIHKWSIATRFLVYVALMISIAIALLGALTTNGVPPQVEAPAYGAPSNYVANWLFLNSRGTSSFFFAITLHSWVAPEWYYAFLMGLISLIFFPVIMLGGTKEKTPVSTVREEKKYFRRPAVR